MRAIAKNLWISLFLLMYACGGSAPRGNDGVDVRDSLSPDADAAPYFGPGPKDASASDSVLWRKDHKGISDMGDAPSDAQTNGGFGSPCNTEADCQSGWCLPHLGGKVCSKECLEDCPDGFSCELFTMTTPDPVMLCISKYPVLCVPCDEDGDCSSTMQTFTPSCVSYGGARGSFCGGSCQLDLDCPQGFTCEAVETTSGAQLLQCIPLEWECECSRISIANGKSTECRVSNVFGTCKGRRFCTQEGLSECDAHAPDQELCNGEDDDCSGAIDDGASCDDQNPCTSDACVNGSCVYSAQIEAACDDGDPCTRDDHCIQGACSGLPVTCEDDNPCTDDLCEQGEGCTHTPNSETCDDGDPCTTEDLCVSGECHGAGTQNCDDLDPCTDDLCVPMMGCEHVENSAACDDQDACTLIDTCVNGQCIGEGALDCDDSNPCTADACTAAQGCVHTPSGGFCDDGDPCSTNDHCEAGECLGSGSLDCNDGNICTDDTCVPGSGCQHSQNSAPCDDLNACTTDDRCFGGQCTGGTLLTCNDGNPCTLDACNSSTGCISTPTAVPCDDGNPCTTGDFCQGGACHGTGQLDCNDDNPCTIDSCDPVFSCLHELQPGFQCWPAAMQACGDGGVQTCTDTCIWGPCQGCAGPDSAPCGNCGNQTRLCLGGTWSAWSSCEDQGECTPEAEETCGVQGIRTCTEQCTWGICQEPACVGPAQQTCGNCGTQTRTCLAGGAWSAWSICSDEGVCAPLSTSPCGIQRTKTCTGQCTWGICEEPVCIGSSSQTCGKCGTQTRTCLAGNVWSAWSACLDEGVCAPHELGACEDNGTRTCNDSCLWGPCLPSVCIGPEMVTCGMCGTKSRTCLSGNIWSSWGPCENQGECLPGSVGQCTMSWSDPGQQTCGSSCTYGPCIPSLPCIKLSGSTLLMAAACFQLHDGTLVQDVVDEGNLCGIGWGLGDWHFHHIEQPVSDSNNDGWVEYPLPSIQPGLAPYPGCTFCSNGLPFRFSFKRCGAPNWPVGGWLSCGNSFSDDRVGNFGWAGYADTCDQTGSLALSWTPTQGYWASGAETTTLGCGN